VNRPGAAGGVEKARAGATDPSGGSLTITREGRRPERALGEDTPQKRVGGPHVGERLLVVLRQSQGIYSKTCIMVIPAQQLLCVIITALS
jgi:hypothetical protein